MSSNIYSVGLNHVGAYQVSGTPFFETQLLNPTIDESIRFQFPKVTKRIIVRTATSQPVRVHFVPWLSSDPGFPEYTADASTNNNYFSVDINAPMEFNVKCKEVFVSSPNAGVSNDFITVFAELTNIPAGRMFDLQGLEGVSQ